MTAPRLVALGLAAWLASAVPARAHFLFVYIGPVAEGGRFAEVYFSEYAEAGDPRFIEKIKHTKLWLQRKPGSFEALVVHKAADRLRAPVPADGSYAVIGICEYGVLERPKQLPFLLRHFPKAVAGQPDELNRLKPSDRVPLEIVATFDKDGIHFVALREGKAIPRAEFWTVAADLSGGKQVAGADGRWSWKPPRPGNYSVYTSHWHKTAGKFGTKEYGEVRDFATLAFRWPPTSTGGDPAATALFEEAIAARARWQRLPGFSARVKGRLDGRPFAGSVSVDAKGEVFTEIEDEGGQAWVQEQLESIVLHRAAESAPTKKAKPALRFADFDLHHPLGRLVAVEGGRMASSYRIKDKQILVVNRHLGKEYMTITVQENDRNAAGQFLPRTYTVQFWDAESRNLLRSQVIQQRWKRLGEWDLPESHTVTTSSATGVSVSTMELSRHELARPK